MDVNTKNKEKRVSRHKGTGAHRLQGESAGGHLDAKYLSMIQE